MCAVLRTPPSRHDSRGASATSTGGSPRSVQYACSTSGAYAWGVGGGACGTRSTKKVLCAELVPSEFEERFHERPVSRICRSVRWSGTGRRIRSVPTSSRRRPSSHVRRGGSQGSSSRRSGSVLTRSPSMPTAGPLVGMDNYISPPRQLPGSLYWVPRGCSRSGSRRSSLTPSEPGFVASWWKGTVHPVTRKTARRSGGGSSTSCTPCRRAASPASGRR